MTKHKPVYSLHILFSYQPYGELMDSARYLTYIVPSIQRQVCFMISPPSPMETKAQRGSVTCLRTHNKQPTGLMSTQNTLCPLICPCITTCGSLPIIVHWLFLLRITSASNTFLGGGGHDKC